MVPLGAAPVASRSIERSDNAFATPMACIELVRRLCNPSAYPHPVDAVQLIQTHVSYVFLAGDYAYKVKKPVDFGFLNFESLKRRRHFCLREVQLNSRLSPGLYLGVVPIIVDATGVHVSKSCIKPGASAAEESPDLPQRTQATPRSGEVVEYAVKMFRLPADQMMDAQLQAGLLKAERLKQLAQKLARFHAQARSGPRVAHFGAPREIARLWNENFEQTEGSIGSSLSRAQYQLLTQYVRASMTRNHSLFLRRMEMNRIREGHGDLRTSAVCFNASFPDGICIFDCIEFNRRFRCCDTASEVAFLAMDLELHGRADLGREFAEAYAKASGDGELLRLLPFYECYRAFVRGKVESFRFLAPEVSDAEKGRALELSRRAFALACQYADQQRPPVLIIMSGLSATGKTTLAHELATQLSMKVISSDVVRKELAGLAPQDSRVGPLGVGLYAPAQKRAVYDALRVRAASALSSGESVILDATFGERAQREAARTLAAEWGGYFFCVECRADDDAVRIRMREREQYGSSSDARWPVYLQQKREFEPLDELGNWSHIVVDTSRPLLESAAASLAALSDRLRPLGARNEKPADEMSHS